MIRHPPSSQLVLSRSMFGNESFKPVHKAQQLIYSLRLKREGCQQILDALAAKIRTETNGEREMPWNKVFDTFRNAANKVADLAEWGKGI